MLCLRCLLFIHKIKNYKYWLEQKLLFLLDLGGTLMLEEFSFRVVNIALAPCDHRSFDAKTGVPHNNVLFFGYHWYLKYSLHLLRKVLSRRWHIDQLIGEGKIISININQSRHELLRWRRDKNHLSRHSSYHLVTSHVSRFFGERRA